MSSGYRTTAASLVDVFRDAVEADPQRRILTHLADGETVDSVWTVAELDRRVRAIAATLQGFSSPGDRALIVHPNGPEYIATFYGCLYAGVIPVPVYLPTTSRFRRTVAGVRAIAEDCAATAVFTPAPLGSWAPLAALDTLPDFRRWVHPHDIDEAAAQSWKPPHLSADTVAFLQYTSGSTGQPKGVMVTHRNLVRYGHAYGEILGCDADSVTVSWLPLYHDYGIIGATTAPFVWGAEVVLMTPDDFVARPARWLEAVSRFRGVYAPAPNFAFDLCVRKVTEEERAGLDLSTWRAAPNAAEPVRRDTLERFLRTFGPVGFCRDSSRPGWGLAEATLIITADADRGEASTLVVDDAALAERRVVPAAPGQPRTKTLVSCGTPIAEHTVAIVDPRTGERCDEHSVGEIWVAGPCLASGYWQRPEQTEETFHNRLDPDGPAYLRTGDLGFVHGGQLYIAGRIKDVIIVRGQNFYPQDIEYVVERADRGIRPGCGAAFAVDLADTEFAVLVQEVDPTRLTDPEAVLRKVRDLVAAEFDLLLDGVYLVEPRSILKTSSGKIQRSGCRAALQRGELAVLASWRRESFATALAEVGGLPVGPS